MIGFDPQAAMFGTLVGVAFVVCLLFTLFIEEVEKKEIAATLFAVIFLGLGLYSFLS